MQVRFYVDTFDVRMRGAGGDAQFLGNFSLRQAHCIEREDLGLSDAPLSVKSDLRARTAFL